MLLKEKIGQMLMIGFDGIELSPQDTIVQSILSQSIGGVILFDYHCQNKIFHRNIKNPDQLKHLTHQLQNYALQSTLKRGCRFVPLFIGIDYEGGQVNRLKEKNGFPKTRSAADMGQRSLGEAYCDAKQMAKTLNQAGINLNFAPVLDINVNPDNPIVGKLGRSFSTKPEQVIEYAALFSTVYEAHRIMYAYKHFPGHGSSIGDTHAGFADISQTWKPYELEPYIQLLKQYRNNPMVMTAHLMHKGLDNDGHPASLSYSMTQKLLRETLDFNGVVITDDLQMKAITDHYGLADAVRLAVNAGADILVFGNQLVPSPQDPQQIIEMIYQYVVEGKIAEYRINESYLRIMQQKQLLTLKD